MSRAQAATELVRAQARPLEMPGLARAFEALARQAREEGWTHEEYLYEVLAAELASRAESAVRQRRHVGFWRAADLVRTLLEARDARELTRLQRRLARLHLLIVDELGFVPFDRPGGELLFNLAARGRIR